MRQSMLTARRLFWAMPRCARRLCRTRLAPILLALVAGHLAPAAADHSFAHATDLGVTTEWDAAGREFVGTIEDAEGEDQQYLKFRTEVAGPIRVWTTGGFNPSLRLFDSNQNPLTSWSRGERYLNPVDSGTYYITASSGTAGRYRLHVAGGGRGHDDVGNVSETATLVTPTQGSEEPPLSRLEPTGDDRVEVPVDVYRIDYPSDIDFFTFKVPPRFTSVGAYLHVGSHRH